MSSPLHLQQCPACQIRCLDGFYDGWLVAVQLLFCGVLPPELVQYCLKHSCVFAVEFFSGRFVSVHLVHPFWSFDMTTAWKKLRFILSARSAFYMTDSISIAVHTFASYKLLSFSVDETLLPTYVNVFGFVWVHMEAYPTSYPFQTV